VLVVPPTKDTFGRLLSWFDLPIHHQVDFVLTAANELPMVSFKTPALSVLI
jgi:hypothetical protein